MGMEPWNRIMVRFLRVNLLMGPINAKMGNLRTKNRAIKAGSTTGVIMGGEFRR